MKHRTDLQDGTEALQELRKKMEIQNGEERFNESLTVARYERELIDSITRFRKQHKITQKDLAKEIDTRHQQISKYERAEQSPFALLKICEALGLELSLKSRDDNEVIFHT